MFWPSSQCECAAQINDIAEGLIADLYIGWKKRSGKDINYGSSEA